MLKKLLKIIKSKQFLYTLGIALFVFGFMYVMNMNYYNQIFKGENFDTEIDQDKQKYDDALEKRIAEVKKEHPRFDAELALDVNRPYEADKEDDKGWWSNVINCTKNGDLEIYCKEKSSWIWPY